MSGNTLFRKKVTFLVYAVVAAATLLSSLAYPGQAEAAAKLTACQKAFKGHPVLQKRCKTISYIGHRGQHYPADVTNENTMLALKAAQKVGAGCETDTWPLKSDDGQRAKGIAVILHDEKLKRTVSADSIAAAGLTPDTKIEDVTYAQFQVLRTKGGEPLPTLKEWVTYAAENKMTCRIEIKWGPSAEQMHELADIIRTNKAQKRVTFYGAPKIGSCDITPYTKWVDDPYMKGIIFGLKQRGECTDLTPAAVSEKGFKYVTISTQIFNNTPAAKRVIAEYHAYGIKVGNHNSGVAQSWKRIIKAGGDFIIASNPAELKKWLRG